MVPKTEVENMKARVLIAVLAMALAPACSTSALPTAAESPSLDGVGTVGSGHRSDPASDESEKDGGGMMGSGHGGDPIPDESETDSSGILGSGH